MNSVQMIDIQQSQPTATPTQTPSATPTAAQSTPAPTQGLLRAPSVVPSGGTADELTSYQVDKLLSKDSPLRQRAEAFGKNYATSRGLLNSDLGAQATFGAFVDRVTPIAAADADRFGQAKDRDVNNANQHSLLDKNLAHSTLMQQSDQSWRSGENALDRTHQSSMQAGEQAWRSGENAMDRTHQGSMQAQQQEFAATQAALDRDHTDRIELERSKNELERMGYGFQLDQYNLNTSAQNNIQTGLLNQIMAIQADPNLDPAAKEIAIKNARDAAESVAKTIATTMKTPIVRPTVEFNSERASNVMVDEAAKAGFTNPTVDDINNALAYAKENNLTEAQMRAYVREEVAKSNASKPVNPQTLIDLAKQYGYEGTMKEAQDIAQYAFDNGLDPREVVMAELRKLGFV